MISTVTFYASFNGRVRAVAQKTHPKIAAQLTHSFIYLADLNRSLSPVVRE